MYFPEKEGGRATIQNSNKNEGWTVGTQLLVDIDDPATLKKMNRVAANLGMTVAKVMIILKIKWKIVRQLFVLHLRSTTIMIYIQEVATKMKTTLGDLVVSHSLMENQKPVHQTTVVNANYGHAPTMMMMTTTKIK